MHRAIGYLSKRFVDIRPGEGRKVLLTFSYFFLVITAYYVIKPVSRSLILGELGSRMVPYVDLIAALLMGPIVTVFARLADRMHKTQLVSVSFWAVIGVLLIFWRLLAWPAPWIAGAFYVWVAIFSVLVVTLFWLVANDLYRPQEAKRLFGFIGSGGILGGIVGSSFAAIGAQIIGTEHLLLLSAGLLAMSWYVVSRLWHYAPDRASDQEPAQRPGRREPFVTDVRALVTTVLRSRYFLLLITIVCLNKVIAALVYYQLNPFIEHTFPDQDARTTFTAMFLSGVNVLAFAIQFFFTSWILRRWGLMVALLAWPLGVLAGTAGLLVAPVFWLAATTELYDASMNYSLHQTTKEVLYLPIDRSIRYKVKPFIDMVVFRFGKGIAAVIGIVLLNFLNVPPRALSYLVVPLLVVWIAAAVRLRRDYVATVRMTLQARAAAQAPDRPHPANGASASAAASGDDWFEPFSSLTNGQLAAQKLAFIHQLVGAQNGGLSQGKALLAELAAYEALEAPAAETPADATRLKRLINDPREPIAHRRQAVRRLARVGGQETVDYFLGLVMAQMDAAVRQDALKGLVRLRLRGERLEFPTPAIRRQIAQEVAACQRVWHVEAIYRQHRRRPVAPDDAVVPLLRALREESIQQIFRLLMLLYRPEDIHLIYEQMRVSDAYLRTDALELLDNLVDPVMRRTIAPILEDDDDTAALDSRAGFLLEPATAYRVLQEAIWDHNCWLSVTTLCAVGRLRLTTMRPEVERACHHTAPVIAAAAKTALALAAAPDPTSQTLL